MLPQSASSFFPDLLAAAARILDAGGVVAYPTETVWGLAARPERAAELYARKGREVGKPLQVSCPDAASALALAQPHPALTALQVYWPGPLTVIAPARPGVQRAWGEGAQAVAPGGWIGLRIPAHPVAQALLETAGPLATTSLNPSGQAAAQTQAEAEAYALADLLLPDLLPADQSPDGVSPAGTPSTVLRLPEGPGLPARLLRPGGVSREELQARLAGLGISMAEADG